MMGLPALLLAASMSVVPRDDIFRSDVDGDSCPDGRIVRSDVRYGLDEPVPDVDVTVFENLWGYASDSAPPILWPGLNGSAPEIIDFTRTGYVAAKFHTTPDPSDMLRGMFVYSSYPFTAPPIDLAISAQCGDFSPEQAGCVALDDANVDAPLLHWGFGSSPPFFCELRPDTDYYVNVRFNDPTATTPNCPASDAACVLPNLQSYFAQ